MKVKMFFKKELEKGKEINIQALDEEINAWLEQNPNIKVIDIKQSASGGSVNRSSICISLWYESA